MVLEHVSATAIRADIRQIILGARQQLRSLNEQKDKLKAFERSWHELVARKR